MSPRERIAEVVARARRRAMWNLTLDELTLAACFSLAGAILILFFGTALLSWFWAGVVAAAAAGSAAWRVSRRMPTSYATAQVVDRRLDLHDALSTALFFEKPGARPFAESMFALHRERAAALAPQVDPRIAVPLEAPRHRYLFGALLLGVVGIFILRFGLEQRLDVRAPLAELIFDAFSGRVAQRAALGRKAAPNVRVDPAHPDAPTTEEHPEEPGTFDPAREDALQSVTTPDVDNSKVVERSETNASKNKGESPGEGEPEDAEQGDMGADGGGQPSAGGQERPGAAKNPQSDGGKQPPSAMSNDSSLSSKLRDAFSNLMSTLKPKSSAGAGKQGQNQQGQGKDPQQMAGAGQRGQAQPGQNQSGQQSGDSESGQGSEDAQAGQNSDGKTSGKGGDQNSSQQPGSGMGKQDGSKDVKLAEQLAAMGKITEIIGKRSQSISGETTIEVQSTKQQLRTSYVNSQAAHGQAAGEIHRDEVPAAAQQYVQQYFERIRRPAPTAAAPKPAAGQVQPPVGDRSGR